MVGRVGGGRHAAVFSASHVCLRKCLLSQLEARRRGDSGGGSVMLGLLDGECRICLTCHATCQKVERIGSMKNKENAFFFSEKVLGLFLALCV